MSIIFISADETLLLRSQQLRNNKALEECRFDSDYLPGAFHLAYKNEKNEIVCILSCLPNDNQALRGVGYQLRGMATRADCQGKGLGRQLVSFCMDYLKEKNCDYLWCNARKIAYLFYEKMGFEFLTEEFEIQNIGTHREMYIMLS